MWKIYYISPHLMHGFPWEIFRRGDFSWKLHENERISIFSKGLSKMKEFEGLRGGNLSPEGGGGFPKMSPEGGAPPLGKTLWCDVLFSSSLCFPQPYFSLFLHHPGGATVGQNIYKHILRFGADLIWRSSGNIKFGVDLIWRFETKITNSAKFSPRQNLSEYIIDQFSS